MDISERRVPQDGRIKLKVSKTKAIDFRVNTLTGSVWRENLSADSRPQQRQNGHRCTWVTRRTRKALYLEALNKPQGMFLVTGPTGSGKTVSCIRALIF